MAAEFDPLSHPLVRWDRRALGRQTLLAVASGLDARGGTRLNDAPAFVLGGFRGIAAGGRCWW
ncbi:MAG: hypothetical protein Q9Q40_08335 [Acidobacteriota bacterium]|nr:hypothetical protein [Acidobacteriota bacterium]MDQ7087757.1 hypothetical protein [Acidobacteriota bacterium]